MNVMGAFAVAMADRLTDATEAASGMTGAAPAALVALQQFLSGRTTEDLAQAMGLTHSGAVRLVDRLVESGLVVRRAGRDRRSSAIVLTARGRALSRKVTATRASAIETAFQDLSARDRRALLPLVETLVATMTVQRLHARTGNDGPAWLCRLCDFEACGRPHGDCPAAAAASDQIQGR